MGTGANGDGDDHDGDQGADGDADPGAADIEAGGRGNDDRDNQQGQLPWSHRLSLAGATAVSSPAQAPFMIAVGVTRTDAVAIFIQSTSPQSLPRWICAPLERGNRNDY
jgi:hypothetical protein